MSWKVLPLVTLAAVLAPVRVEAQASIYAQCGGIGWSGATSCGTGLMCSSINAYYYQCLSGSATAAPTSAHSSAPSSTSVSAKPTSSSKGGSGTTSASSGGSTGAAAGNPFSGYQIYANPYYSSEIYSEAIPSMTGSQSALAAKASEVAKVGTFSWLDAVAKVPSMATFLSDIQTQNMAGASPPIMGAFVVYDLPDRDCAADASNGEFTVADNGVANYKGYIDSIVTQLKAYPSVNVALIIEPDSLANMVTNLNVAKCAEAQDAYYECVNYALMQLNMPNVAMYIDAGHAGWLGWQPNLGPAAQLFATVYKNASAPASLRGLATNVANYNAWQISSPPQYTSGDSNYDESLYINALAPLLEQQGWPSPKFVMDTSRNGVQPTAQQAWGDWCNVKGTGFGVRPTTSTGDPLEDAFVWIKPGGECDGTSNSTAPRYDAHCSLSDALQPSPQAGTWFQAYFVQLLTNANPSF